MRLPNSEHLARNWRIDEITPDFTLEDVWALPAWGSGEDFGRLIDVMGSLDLANGRSPATRVLIGVRHHLGRWLGWDDPAAPLSIPGETGMTLSARLPQDLRGPCTDRGPRTSGFTPLYRTDREWAAELSNRTVHAVMHLAWAEQGRSRFQGQMAVLVKPRGRFGEAYMALIAPFRHLVVYPALMRHIEHAWNARAA